jgi:hypothetical protein
LNFLCTWLLHFQWSALQILVTSASLIFDLCLFSKVSGVTWVSLTSEAARKVSLGKKASSKPHFICFLFLGDSSLVLPVAWQQQFHRFCSVFELFFIGGFFSRCLSMVAGSRTSKFPESTIKAVILPWAGIHNVEGAPLKWYDHSRCNLVLLRALVKIRL